MIDAIVVNLADREKDTDGRLYFSYGSSFPCSTAIVVQIAMREDGAFAKHISSESNQIHVGGRM